MVTRSAASLNVSTTVRRTAGSKESSSATNATGRIRFRQQGVYALPPLSNSDFFANRGDRIEPRGRARRIPRREDRERDRDDIHVRDVIALDRKRQIADEVDVARQSHERIVIRGPREPHPPPSAHTTPPASPPHTP